MLFIYCRAIKSCSSIGIHLPSRHAHILASNIKASTNKIPLFSFEKLVCQAANCQYSSSRRTHSHTVYIPCHSSPEFGCVRVSGSFWWYLFSLPILFFYLPSFARKLPFFESHPLLSSWSFLWPNLVKWLTILLSFSRVCSWSLLTANSLEDAHQKTVSSLLSLSFFLSPAFLLTPVNQSYFQNWHPSWLVCNYDCYFNFTGTVSTTISALYLTLLISKETLFLRTNLH